MGRLSGARLRSLGGVRLGGLPLPAGVGIRQLMGVAAVAGIGFTVSLFVTDLAFRGPALVDTAKIGILGASIVAGALGFALLRPAGTSRGEVAEDARTDRGE